MEGPPGKNRRPNFSQEECTVLISEIKKGSTIVLGKLDSNCTVKLKNHAWDEIVKAVNLTGQSPHDVGEVRRKFSDLRVQVKKKAAQERRYMGGTGGGPNIETSYSALEEAVLQLIAPTSIYGLPGATDTDDTSFVEQEPIEPSRIRITLIQTAEESMTIVLSDSQEQLTVPIVPAEIGLPFFTHEIFGSSLSTASNTQQALSATKEERSRHRTSDNVAEDTDATDELGLRTPTGPHRCKSRTGTPTGYLSSNVDATCSYTPNRPTSRTRSRSGATSQHSEELRLIPEVLQAQVEFNGMVRELVATGDRIATGSIDEVATNERIATGIDRIAASNERIATGIDKIATALQTMAEAMQAKK